MRFKDRWRWDKDVHQEWIDQIHDDWPGVWSVINTARVTFGSDMAAYLCWLGVRLMEMRRILRGDGSIYLHIDHTAHAYVKALMDAIFGRKHFRNEIVWLYKTGGTSKRWFSRKHDSLLFYTKSNKYNFEPQTEKSYLKHKYGFSNITILEDEGGLYREVGMRDVWDIPALRGNQPESRGYPTQKPLALYERIIRASSKPGEYVFDPFCGCATTPVAAERLGRKWVGMDIWDKAHEMVLNRMADEGLAVPDGEAHAIGQTRLMTFGDVQYVTTPPIRTDDNEVAVPILRLRLQPAAEPWQKLSRSAITEILRDAQQRNALVVCGGCGRELEKEFMHLDHIQPRSERGANHILNRILLCAPCNGTKGDVFTLKGLLRENNRSGWMQDKNGAVSAQRRATGKAEWIRDFWDTPECQQLLNTLLEG